MDLAGGLTRAERVSSGTSSALQDLVRDLLKNGHNKIVLNLRSVAYLDSSGVGELFGCFSAVDSAGGALKLASPAEYVRTVLRLAKISAVVDVIEDEATAIRSFSRPPG